MNTSAVRVYAAWARNSTSRTAQYSASEAISKVAQAAYSALAKTISRAVSRRAPSMAMTRGVGAACSVECALSWNRCGPTRPSGSTTAYPAGEKPSSAFGAKNPSGVLVQGWPRASLPLNCRDCSGSRGNHSTRGPLLDAGRSKSSVACNGMPAPGPATIRDPAEAASPSPRLTRTATSPGIGASALTSQARARPNTASAPSRASIGSSRFTTVIRRCPRPSHRRHRFRHP